jgi:predicted house-cleaning noncanonical NTP pyrophosphatase (MazG superfamily)
MITWNKLVRDRVPEIIEASGTTAATRVLDPDNFRTALLEKLREETEELIRAEEDEMANEAADVLEVVETLCELHGISLSDVLAKKAAKRASRGAFTQRLFLIHTIPRR